MIDTRHDADIESGHTDSAQSPSPASFVPSDCLLANFQSALQASGATMISGAHGRVLIDPQSRLYCDAIPERDAFFRSAPQSLQTTHHTPGPGGTWRPVEELLWEAAYHGPEGALLAPLSPLTAVRLRRWPNLTRVSHTPVTISLCALLDKRALSTAVAIRMLRAPETEAWRFFSAALASGVARRIGDVSHSSGAGPDQPSGASRRVASFWSQLFAKLAGG